MAHIAPSSDTLSLLPVPQYLPPEAGYKNLPGVPGQCWDNLYLVPQLKDCYPWSWNSPQGPSPRCWSQQNIAFRGNEEWMSSNSKDIKHDPFYSLVPHLFWNQWKLDQLGPSSRWKGHNSMSPTRTLELDGCGEPHLLDRKPSTQQPPMDSKVEILQNTLLVRSVSGTQECILNTKRVRTSLGRTYLTEWKSSPNKGQGGLFMRSKKLGLHKCF